MKQQNSDSYEQKIKSMQNILTIYGRNPVLEALQNNELKIEKVHFATSNQQTKAIQEIINICQQRKIEVKSHTRETLSRISKNGKQDQGIAADIRLHGMQSFDEIKKENLVYKKLIAVDRVTNPQNLGMIIRSVCAGNTDGLLLPQQGSSPLNPLVIKASAGTIFKTPIYKCPNLETAIVHLKKIGFQCASLALTAQTDFFSFKPSAPILYILGNENDGVSNQIEKLCDHQLRIPMNRNVESLNVATTATLIAFHN